MKVEDMQKLVRTENNMVRWMSGVTLKDKRSSEELRRGLGIVGVDRVVSRGRLRWFVHVERKEAGDWVSKCRNLEVIIIIIDSLIYRWSLIGGRWCKEREA